MKESMKPLPKFTIGMGDRFGAEGEAQLAAIISARAEGIDIHPVWNKSNREHGIVGTEPQSLREEADAAVRTAGFSAPYFVDADHITLATADRFVACSDFFTLDVADFVGKPADAADLAAFIERHRKYIGALPVEGGGLVLEEGEMESAAAKFLLAIREAGAIYRRIASLKGREAFATEVSIDETDMAQSPGELFCILAMIAQEGIPAQTVAPKFTGRFNKGVDYVGDLKQFEREFDQDLQVIRLAVKEFGLPTSLKLSVHSGSDKFSLYPIIRRLTQEHQCGLHLKTAGTTWLEEVIGLAQAGGAGLLLAQEIYCDSFAHRDELVAPYRTVVDIRPEKLPLPETVFKWDSATFVSSLRHDPGNLGYNKDLRQLLHVGFKVAAKRGSEFLDALQSHRETIARNVTTNLLDRHIRPVFGRRG